MTLTHLPLWQNDLCARGVVGVRDRMTQQAHGPHHFAGPPHLVWKI